MMPFCCTTSFIREGLRGPGTRFIKYFESAQRWGGPHRVASSSGTTASGGATVYQPRNCMPSRSWHETLHSAFCCAQPQPPPAQPCASRALQVAFTCGGEDELGVRLFDHSHLHVARHFKFHTFTGGQYSSEARCRFCVHHIDCTRTFGRMSIEP